MNFKHLAAAAAAVTVGALCAPAQAALHDRGNGLIYDDALNITWLQDLNYAKTSGYDTDGRMGWNAAVTWADQLSYGGYTDWRLPTITDTGTPGCELSYAGGTDCGYNVQTASGGTVYSEMAHLWYVTLGNKGFCAPGVVNCNTPQAGWGFNNTGPFLNAQSFIYWSGTEYTLNTSYAWFFSSSDGFQYGSGKDALFYAVAVRPGDVAAVSAVPEPETYALMLMGLAALAVAAKRRPR